MQALLIAVALLGQVGDTLEPPGATSRAQSPTDLPTVDLSPPGVVADGHEPRIRSLEDRVDRLERVVVQHGEQLELMQQSMTDINMGLKEIHHQLEGLRGDLKRLPKPMELRITPPKPIPTPSKQRPPADIPDPRPAPADKVASARYGLFTVSNRYPQTLTVRINGVPNTVGPCSDRRFWVPVDDVVTELVGYEPVRRWSRTAWHARDGVFRMGVNIN